MSELSSKSYEVLIEKLTIGGDGLCRIDGQVCFVPYGVPGDRLKIEITEEKKDFLRGKILQILEPSSHRQEAPCTFFGRCGGCNWQHIKISSQEKFKQDLVAEALKKKLPEQNFEFLPLVSSPQEYHYRNRITLKFDGQSLGYFQKKSHDLVPIAQCLLAEKEINHELGEISRNKAAALLKTRKQESGYSNIRIFQSPSKGTKWICTEEDDASIGFSQVNSAQNENLIRTVLDWATLQNTSAFYDLYSGAGNFTFPLYEAHKFKKVFAIEASHELTNLGKDLRGKRTRIKFITARVEDFLAHQDLEPDSFILLDPPRGGCEPSVLSALATSQAEKIIYISCHPASLARDLERFWSHPASSNFYLRRVQCFDMFPQTDHVETVAEIARR